MSFTIKQHKPTPYSGICMTNQRLQYLLVQFHLPSEANPVQSFNSRLDLSVLNYTWIKLNVAGLSHVQIHCCLILPVLCLVLIYSHWLASQQQAKEY